jgi:O-acetyl-ADP-ribose deacetylase (regulator of RNase III)
MPGGGVAGAIHRGAGPGLAVECRELAPIRPGEAVITKAYKLPNRAVIHCLGPVYGYDNPSEILLSNCYRNALLLAEKSKLNSIAFPSISTGVFGYPMREAAKVAFSTVHKLLPQLQHLKRIRFVLFGSEALKIHEKVFEEIFIRDGFEDQ